MSITISVACPSCALYDRGPCSARATPAVDRRKPSQRPFAFCFLDTSAQPICHLCCAHLVSRPFEESAEQPFGDVLLVRDVGHEHPVRQGTQKKAAQDPAQAVCQLVPGVQDNILALAGAHAGVESKV